MPVLTNVPIPLTDPVIVPSQLRERGENDGFTARLARVLSTFRLSQAWADYFLNQVRVSESTPVRVNSVSLTGQNAAIGATDFSNGSVTSGLYRFAWYARITQAATTSSSLTVTVDWTDGGVTPSFSGAAMTGNTTTTIQSETKLIHVDTASPVRYSTAYASVGATPMLYRLDLVLEKVNA